jgi:hypothetical protein
MTTATIEVPYHWSEKHLIPFLYISVANSESDISDEKKRVLETNIDDLLKNRYHLSDMTCNQLLSEVYSMPIANDFERMAVIKELSKRIELDWDTYKYVANKLVDIAHADKNISIEEHSVMYFFRLRFRKDYHMHQAMLA